MFLDNAGLAEIKSIKKHTVEVPREETFTQYLPTEKIQVLLSKFIILQNERVINLMHNNKGFNKEIGFPGCGVSKPPRQIRYLKETYENRPYSS